MELLGASKFFMYVFDNFTNNYYINSMLKYCEKHWINTGEEDQQGYFPHKA